MKASCSRVTLSTGSPSRLLTGISTPVSSPGTPSGTTAPWLSSPTASTPAWRSTSMRTLVRSWWNSLIASDWLFSVDMDEFIVPTIDLDSQTTPDLVNMIGRFKKAPHNKRSDAFLFKNSFFCGEYNNDSVPDPHSDKNFNIFRLILEIWINCKITGKYLRSTFREDYIWSYKLRAKMLARTSAVVAVGHHMWVS